MYSNLPDLSDDPGHVDISWSTNTSLSERNETLLSTPILLDPQVSYASKPVIPVSQEKEDQESVGMHGDKLKHVSTFVKHL